MREGVYYFALYIHCAARISVRFPNKSLGIDLDKLIGLMNVVINRSFVSLACYYEARRLAQCSDCSIVVLGFCFFATTSKRSLVSIGSQYKVDGAWNYTSTPQHV